jgi:Oxidoreductase family, NAD-binding Rossmann fold
MIRYRVAIIGTGGIAQYHMQALDAVKERVEVVAAVDVLRERAEAYSSKNAIPHFYNHALGSIVNSVLSPREETYLRFDFQKATVELTALYSYTNQNWRFSQPPSIQDAAVVTHWQELTQDQPASHTTQLAYLLDSLDHHTRPLSNTLDVRPTIEFITGIYKSAATGQKIRQGSIIEGDPFYDHVSGHAPEGVQR